MDEAADERSDFSSIPNPVEVQNPTPNLARRTPVVSSTNHTAEFINLPAGPDQPMFIFLNPHSMPKEHKLQEEKEELRRKLVDAKGIADAAARGVQGLGSNLQSPNSRSEIAPTQSLPTVYPLQPNLRDTRPISQPSLQLGLFAQSSSRSRGPSHQNSGPENDATSRSSEWMLQQ